MTDEELVELIRKGKDRFKEFESRYGGIPWKYRQKLLLLADQDGVEPTDIAIEALQHAYLAVRDGKFHGESRPGTWVHSVVHNHLRAGLRRKRLAAADLPPDEKGDLDDGQGQQGYPDMNLHDALEHLGRNLDVGRQAHRDGERRDLSF